MASVRVSVAERRIRQWIVTRWWFWDRHGKTIVPPIPAALPAGTQKGSALRMPVCSRLPSSRTATVVAEGTLQPRVTWAWPAWASRHQKERGAANWTIFGAPEAVVIVGTVGAEVVVAAGMVVPPGSIEPPDGL